MIIEVYSNLKNERRIKMIIMSMIIGVISVTAASIMYDLSEIQICNNEIKILEEEIKILKRDL